MTGGRGPRTGGFVAYCLVAILVCSTIGASASVVGATTQHERPGQSTSPVLGHENPPRQSATPTNESANNTSIHHVDPEAVGEEGNLSEVETWLAREMAGQLSESMNVSQRDSERARELVGNDSEYSQLAQKYQNVSEDSSAEGSELGAFGTVGRVQREFLTNVQRYRSTYQKYREVRQNGGNEADNQNTAESRNTAERRLAHELERIATDVNRNATLLNRSYANLSAEGQIDRQNATRTVGRLRSNITETQATVVNQTLVRTRLSLDSVGSPASFANPVTLAGRLRAANGTPLADEQMTLAIGPRNVTTETDSEGRFNVSYRPTLLPVGERTVSIEYRPSNTSVYHRSTANLSVTVRQTTPDVSISNRPERVGYGDNVTVNGTVGASGVGAAEVPVVVSVGGVPVGRTTTGPNGSFGVQSTLPSNVSVGDKRIVARVALSGRAIASANSSAPVTVEPTQTNVSITTAYRQEATTFVSGRLTTADGQPIANRTVRLRVGETTVGTATTNATGGYAATVQIPQSNRGGAVQIVAAYSPGEGNLRPARTTASVALPDDGLLAQHRVLFGAAGLAGLGLGMLLVLRFRSRGWRSPGTTEEAGANAANRQVDEAAVERSVDALLDATEAHLSAGDFDAATEAAYAAVRTKLRGSVEEVGGPVGSSAAGGLRGSVGEARSSVEDGLRDSVEGGFPGATDGGFRTAAGNDSFRTHWEFYAACRAADLPEERLDQLERLTEYYERAAFSSAGVSRDEAETAVQIASEFRSSDEL